MLSFIRPHSAIKVGLALHHDRLHLVKLKQVGLEYQVHAFASTGQSAHTLPLGQRIRQLVQATGSENCHACIGLPAASVIQKRFYLSACLNDSERMAEISEKITDYFPGLQEALHVDCALLGVEGNENEVMVVATRSDYLKRYVLAAEEAGLKVRVVDVDIYALARILNKMGSRSDEPKVILDMDTHTAQFMMLRQQKIAAAQAFTLDQKLPLTPQLKRIFQLFCATAHLPKIEKIILVGELNTLSQVQKNITEEMDMIVEIINMRQFLDFKLTAPQNEFYSRQAEFITACGLAMRTFPQW